MTWFKLVAVCATLLSAPIAVVHLGNDLHNKRWPVLGGSFKQSLVATSYSSSFPLPVSTIQRNPLYDADVDELVSNDTVRSVYLIILGLLSRLVMNGFNKTDIENVDELLLALHRRPADRPLITVSNHVHAADDPFTIAAMVPVRDLWDSRRVRWTFCASDRCFKTPLMSRFFEIGKVLPIQRAGGIMQPAMLTAVDKLSRGDWIHIFPEGTRSPTQQIGPMRPGVGMLVATSRVTPIVVPFVHIGMNQITPKGQFLMFKPGNRLRILVGDSLDFTELIRDYRSKGRPERELYRAIADRIGEALQTLNTKANIPLAIDIPPR